jgi:hypothetical protein
LEQIFEQSLIMIQAINLEKEWVGLLGAFILIVSFCFKDMVKFRLINCLAAVVWTFYAVDMQSISMIVTNIFIISLNLKHLCSDKKVKNIAKKIVENLWLKIKFA